MTKAEADSGPGAGRPPPGPETATALTTAERHETELRLTLNRLLVERREATDAAERVGALATLPGASPDLAATAARWSQREAQLTDDVEQARAALRTQQARVERLRADAARA